MQQLPAMARNKIMMAALASLGLGAAVLLWELSPLVLPQPAAPLADDLSLLDEAPLEDMPAEPIAPLGTPTATTFVIVYISGAVQSPDVYQLPALARVKDVVLAAGGLTPDANLDRINLAERLTDAQHIHIPRRGELAAEPAPGTDGTAPPTDSGQQLNINTASAAELEELPEIGQSLAQRIIEYRTTNGLFKSIDDLGNVPGIGPAVLEQIAPRITT